MMPDRYTPMEELDRLIAEDPRKDDPLPPRAAIKRPADALPCAKCGINPRRFRAGSNRVYAYCSACEGVNAAIYQARRLAKRGPKSPEVKRADLDLLAAQMRRQNLTRGSGSAAVLRAIIERTGVDPLYGEAADKG